MQPSSCSWRWEFLTSKLEISTGVGESVQHDHTKAWPHHFSRVKLFTFTFCSSSVFFYFILSQLYFMVINRWYVLTLFVHTKYSVDRYGYICYCCVILSEQEIETIFFQTYWWLESGMLSTRNSSWAVVVVWTPLWLLKNKMFWEDLQNLDLRSTLVYLVELFGLFHLLLLFWRSKTEKLGKL